MYQQTKTYYEANGHLNVPKRYKTEDELGLGSWIHTQRNIRPGVCVGKLTAEAFFKKHGHLEVQAQFVTEKGLRLNKWPSVQRKAHSEGTLTIQQTQRLESIGMHWEPLKTTQWNRMYDALMHYCEQGGSIAQMPQDCTAEQGGNLFNWVKTQKRRQKQGTLEPWQQAKLNALINGTPSPASGG